MLCYVIVNLVDGVVGAEPLDGLHYPVVDEQVFEVDPVLSDQVDDLFRNTIYQYYRLNLAYSLVIQQMLDVVNYNL